MHGHRDMEIISYVVEGALEHKDSLGNGSVIRPGDVQLMRAGTGIMHSEYNPSQTDGTRFLQIWIEPAQSGLEPGYQETRLAAADHPDQFRTLLDPNGSDGALRVAQDVQLLALDLAAGKEATLELPEPRALWVQIVQGSATIAGTLLKEGDAVSFLSLDALTVTAATDLDALIFSLPAQGS
jgi:redox-sensitive bicupin YhaK (pirin superfamily)